MADSTTCGSHASALSAPSFDFRIGMSFSARGTEASALPSTSARCSASSSSFDVPLTVVLPPEDKHVLGPHSLAEGRLQVWHHTPTVMNSSLVECFHQHWLTGKLRSKVGEDLVRRDGNLADVRRAHNKDYTTARSHHPN